MTEPFARERVIASQFDGVREHRREALALLLAAYREELHAVWKKAAERQAKRGQ